MATLLQQLINGLVLGGLIALIALGYTMVYGIIQLINFAHGEVFMVGGFASLATYSYVLPESWRDHGHWPIALPLMALGGAVVAVVLAVAMERLAYRPLRNAPRLAPLITALGVSVILKEAVRLWYPGATAPVPFPRAFVDEQFRFQLGEGTVTIGATAILMIVVSILGAIILQTYITRSRMGRAMRATAQDPDTARLMGVNPNRTIVLTFTIGGALAGLAGVLYGIHITNVDTEVGFLYGIFAFTAAVLGGVGSIKGAVIGGFAIGLIKTLSGQYLPGGTQYDLVWIFVLLIVVLVFRPQGLFGEPERVRA
ncbi:branched-chain amino acid ABC transporter permease [Actinokineospora globicatena]|uniref:Branched-chain amino acid ABC transporter permease n=1 Tax=Actinokineospora globicatena TaxID=103729 RepID=A0A9W6QQ23_9PSEU|nr:branched-chain amino acid ABC transporter permease [Actinokineospora globicatena]MCP2304599.1 amino acid/amide ABC transporter membrane protein 1, HAAT family [Actinokineospora globicatena]GLW78030.1 branched-chain amino acid ABC transporter permease [Actinokineospora globicatena]GLW85304.1 branched-chain amino acid ABC transporter permease [Actinokineospora globicatena]GLW94061.1 branched-chain amino acid ABC transporter permease [Actinokineospora globicatena]